MVSEGKWGNLAEVVDECDAVTVIIEVLDVAFVNDGDGGNIVSEESIFTA